MAAIVSYGDHVKLQVTKDFKQLVNISIAAGKFMLIHPDYELIRKAMMLELFEDEMLEDFEVHNWQFEVDDVITFDLNEALFFYALLELSCRIFLCDIGDDLKKMAIESGETDEHEFIRVRGFYLSAAQDYLISFRSIYESHPAFRELIEKVELLNALA